MTVQPQMSDPALKLEQAPPAACPPFRSRRPRRDGQGDLAVEHWGKARFAVAGCEGSAHQPGQITRQARGLADEGAAQAGQMPEHAHSYVTHGTKDRVVI